METITIIKRQYIAVQSLHNEETSAPR